MLARRGRNYVLGRVAVFDVHAQVALGKIADVPERGQDFVVCAKKLGDRFCFRRRFDDDEGRHGAG
ncbi:MAG: hypothetical protein UY79_C0003G0044 [Parcubacteria group bacterium GW2011_GWA2_53_21]|nr:MAG: hypothetical protein UY79_C0003G0044 [Parcubacteria group bacterium GW2011_GWA2_53_21]